MGSSTARSPVAAAMLNPALLTAIIAAAAEEHARATGEPMPAGFAFLIAPLVLHRDTREALPKRTNSHWATWLSSNPVLQAGFPLRARSLVEPVRDGLRFGVANGVLSITPQGAIMGELAPAARRATVGDMASVTSAAGFVGRWLTRLDRPATAFALLGVAP